MKIAVLGWGSLIWNPRDLKIQGEWSFKGPSLPLEFARISSGNRLTLVIGQKFKKVKTLYAISAFDNLDEARNNLHTREGTLKINSIGFLNYLTGESCFKKDQEYLKELLLEWKKPDDIDAVIWTNLSSNFETTLKKELCIHNLKIHLSCLKPEEYVEAKKYILNAPAQIKTNYRKELTAYMEVREQKPAEHITNQSFFSIPREKLLLYYPEIILNSRAQFKAAEDLAGLGNYGPAISHLLISSEEMVKTFVVTMDAKGFEFRKVKGMDIFFRNHEIRFFIGYFAFVLRLFGDDLFKFLDRLRKDPEKETNALQLLQADESQINKWMSRYFLRKLIIMMQELEWFSKAEVARQNGFYVDVKGEIIAPQHLSQKEYEQAKERIQRVNTTIHYFIDSYLTEDEKLLKEIEKLKERFKKEDYYTKIETELENRRTGKKTFFETFKGFLSELTTDIRDDK